MQDKAGFEFGGADLRLIPLSRITEYGQVNLKRIFRVLFFEGSLDADQSSNLVLASFGFFMDVECIEPRCLRNQLFSQQAVGDHTLDDVTSGSMTDFRIIGSSIIMRNSRMDLSGCHEF